MNHSEGKCVIISAPSGAGKTTIVHHLIAKDLGLAFSVSATSRAKRSHEHDGRDYHFLTAEEFKLRIDADAFVEWEEVYTGQYYGTLKSEVERIWDEGHRPIFDVDVEGGLNLKRAFGANALAIFIAPPSLSVLEQRLHSRGTETPESLLRRLDKAAHELTYAQRFDHVIVNDDLDRACSQAVSLVRAFLS
ncbi:MAG: guanylate kinase [Flavobacteriales bacterium]|nr:guanylate kinase [Flavobacteriales bacterium]